MQVAQTDEGGSQIPTKKHAAIEFIQKVFPYIQAFCETLIFIFEFVFLSALVQVVSTQLDFVRQAKGSSVNECCIDSDNNFTKDWVQCGKCLLYEDAGMIIKGFIYVILWVVVICGYFIWRYKVDIWRFKLRPSKMVLFVLCITIAGIVAMITIQYRTGHWIYSLSNLETISADHNPAKAAAPTNQTIYNDDIDAVPKEGPVPVKNIYISYSRIFQLFIGSPIVEEILFRIILFFTIYKRINRPITSMVSANLVFSSLHLINILFSSATAYTLFQMSAGFLLGMFYSTRYFLTLNLAENILLHIINNLSAIFIPVQITFDDVYPDFIIPMFASILIYIVLLARDIRTIRRKYK